MKKPSGNRGTTPLVILLIGTALLLWLARDWRSTLRPVYPEAMAAAKPALGVNFDPSCCTDIEKEMERISGSGFATIRVTFPWDEIEPEKGTFHWRKWDGLVHAASKNGLGIIAVLDTSPAWARASKDEEDRFAPPQDWREFAPFARKFAERYGSFIDMYQIWNEPNIFPNWGNRNVSAADYVRLLREGYIAIHSADENAIVLSAALAPNVEPGGKNQSDIRFFDEMYKAGGSRWFDAASVQAYGFDLPPSDPPSPQRLNFRRAELLRQIMASHGDAHKPVYVTTFGWNTKESIWKSVPPQTQRDYVKSGVEYALEHWPWSHGLVWALWKPSAPPDSPLWGFALVRSDGSESPAMIGLRSSMQSRPFLGVGRHRPDSPGVQYEGEWRVTAFGADPGKAGGGIRIVFRGKGIALKVRRGNYRAYMTAKVDGLPANSLPKDRHGNAYVQLYDPLHEEAVVPISVNLHPGEHEAYIEAHRGWGQWPIEEIIVIGTGLRRWKLLRPVLFLASLILLMGSLWKLSRTFPAASEMLAAPSVVWGLGVVAFLIPFANTHTLWYEIPLWMLFAWMLFVEKLHGRKQIFRNALPSDGPVAALLIVAIASTLAAERFGVANRELRTVFVDGALIYFLASRAGNVKPAVWGWLIGSAFVASWGLWQGATGHGIITAEGVFRVRGPYGSPNNLALYLERGLMLLLPMILLGKKKTRVAALIIAVPVFAALLLTFSRGALLIGVPAGIATLGVASLLLPRHERKRIWIGLVSVAVLGAVALLPFLHTKRFTSLKSLKTGTSVFRLDLWWSATKMFLDSPWFGVGPDNFLYRYRTFYMLPGAWRDPNLSHPHNFLLDFATRIGIGGLIAGFWLAWESLKPAILHAKTILHEDPYLSLGILAGWSATFAHGLIDNSIFLPDLMALFMLSVGIMASIAHNRDKSL